LVEKKRKVLINCQAKSPGNTPGGGKGRGGAELIDVELGGDETLPGGGIHEQRVGPVVSH